MLDAIIVGAGPNGLSAALALARAGASVQVIEANTSVGGGTQSAELTLPGFLHDVCSTAHPLGALSPWWRTLPLEERGLQWLYPEYSVAHPLDGGRALALAPSMALTQDAFAAAGREDDFVAWERLMRPLQGAQADKLLLDFLSPFQLPRHPFSLARFGLQGVLPARILAGLRLGSADVRGLFAGLAAHATLPMDAPMTGAFGLLFALLAHRVAWPVAQGGSAAISQALAALVQEAGGRIETGRHIRSLEELPESRVVLFDTDASALAAIAGDALPAAYRRRLQNVEMGPATFKIDYALSEPVPWTAPVCHKTATLHLGGTLPEISLSERLAWQGKAPRMPYVIFCQQSLVDPSRAPAGQATGYAYCHVPLGYDGDATEAIEAQIERHAPGFRDTVLARRVWKPADFEAHNPNLVGGSISGGASTWRQLFTRPTLQLNPWRTPNPRLFLCSSSTPPGPGVHGMCGYWAAKAALRTLRLGRPERLLGT